MTNITNLNDHRPIPHKVGPAHCSRCQHQWEAVTPQHMDDALQCPECKNMTGDFLYNCAPSTVAFHCTCDNNLFFIVPEGLQCRGCGFIHAKADIWDDTDNL